MSEAMPVRYEPMAVSAESSAASDWYASTPAGSGTNSATTVAKWRDERSEGDDKELRAAITRAIDASPSLRNKKDLIEAFVDSLSVDGEVDEQWQAFVDARRAEELQRIIEEEGLKSDETHEFMEMAFRDGAIRSTGTAITRVLPPVSRFAPDGAHGEQKQRVLAKLSACFERFFGLGSG